MGPRADELAAQIERLPLDAALKSAVLAGVANTDEETARREAAQLSSALDRIPARRRAIREALSSTERKRPGPAILTAPENRLIVKEVSAPVGNLAIQIQDICPECGQTIPRSSDLHQLLGRFGITEEMISNLSSQMQIADVDEYLNMAREYLNGGKVLDYAKENPGKVAAGAAVLAVGAGLLISALNRE